METFLALITSSRYQISDMRQVYANNLSRIIGQTPLSRLKPTILGFITDMTVCTLAVYLALGLTSVFGLNTRFFIPLFGLSLCILVTSFSDPPDAFCLFNTMLFNIRFIQVNSW